MRRRRSLLTAIAILLSVLAAAGCSGGNSDPTRHDIDTGTPAGSLEGIQILPRPGSTAISRGTGFRIGWLQGSPPPTFEVELIRYREGYSYETRDEDGDTETVRVEAKYEAQRSRLDRAGEQFTWDLIPSFEMARGGLYYLSIRSGPDSLEVLYRVDDSRAVPTRAAPADGAYTHTVIAR